MPGLFRGNTSKNNGDFYCLNSLHSFRTKNKLNNNKHVRENLDYCHIEMPRENNKILKYNHRRKSMKAPCVIYANLECLL